ncbi:MAG: hypothetical protein ACOC2H_01345 [Spirochaetota bacterium]
MKKEINRILLILAAFVLFSPKNGFSALYENHPPDIRWKVIRTEHFDVIFSSDIEDDARRVANLSEHYLKHNTRTMKPDWRHTTIVLVSESSVANGSVQFVPYMSKFYNSPSTFNATEWYHSLALHEGRHMVQLNTINSEGRKILYYAFGDQGMAAYVVAMVPMWKLEGDAVLMETVLTEDGRGRVPVFDLYVRTNELSASVDQRYSYYRAYLGSHEDNYPMTDHYVLGYHMATYGRIKYGPMIWNDTFRGMGESILHLDHFDYSFKTAKADDHDMVDHYRETYNFLRHCWSEQISGLEFTDSQTITRTGSQRWSGFLQLHESDGRLYCLQTGKEMISGIAEISSGSAHLVTQIPVSEVLTAARKNERSFSVGGGRAVWVEQLSDIRWGYRTYSSIMVRELESGRQRRLFPNGKMLSAAISGDGSRISAVEYTESRQCSLIIIDTQTGTVLKRIPSPGNAFLYDTAWSSDNTQIACGSLTTEGSALLMYNVENGSFTELIPHTHDEHPKTPSFAGRYLLYGSDYSGIDNIYAYDLRNGRRYQVTSRKFGAYYPSASKDGGSIYYSDYTVRGYSGEKMRLDPAGWTPLASVPVRRADYYEAVVEQEAGGSVVDDVDGKFYQAENYTPMFHSVNVHSWSPVFDYYYGIGVMSTDHLETTSLSLAYNYNINESAHSVTGSIRYSGLYPILEAGGTLGQRVKMDSDGDYIHWDESTVYGSVTVPFDFSRGIHTTFAEFTVSPSYTEISGKSVIEYDKTVLNDGTIIPVSYSMMLAHLQEGTMLDLYPRWGQIVNVSYTHIPYGDYSSYQMALFSQWFFPSLFMHHSIHFELDYERDDGSDYRFPLQFLYPRGYSEEFAEETYKASVNYSLPLLNMHANIWKIMYFKRLKLTGFYDHGYIVTEELDSGQLLNIEETGEYRRSAGAELVVQYNPFSNKMLQLESGLEYAYRVEDKEWVYNIIFLQFNQTF